jgi:hypothetical protein
VVGVSRADPGRAFADGEAEFEIRFPEATVRSFTRVRVDSDRDTYRIAIELVVDGTVAGPTGDAGNGRSPGTCNEGGPPSGASYAAADGARSTPETRNPGAMAGAGLDEVPR